MIDKFHSLFRVYLNWNYSHIIFWIKIGTRLTSLKKMDGKSRLVYYSACAVYFTLQTVLGIILIKACVVGYWIISSVQIPLAIIFTIWIFYSWRHVQNTATTYHEIGKAWMFVLWHQFVIRSKTRNEYVSWLWKIKLKQEIDWQISSSSQ